MLHTLKMFSSIIYPFLLTSVIDIFTRIYSIVAVCPEQWISTSGMLYNYGDVNITSGLYHTYNLSTPFVADALIYDDMGWKLVVIISATHMKQKSSTFQGTFLLLYAGQYIRGEKKLHELNLLIMKYTLPHLRDFTGRVVFSIVNEQSKLYYPNCTAQIVSHHGKQGIATCSLVTNFENFYDVSNFIAFNLFAGVNTVILYVSEQFNYIPVLHFLFGKRIKIVHFWPVRNITLGQNDVQIAEINSCYYRNRDQYKYLIMLDIDELLFNHTNMTLIDLIDSLFSSPEYSAIHLSFNTIIHI